MSDCPCICQIEIVFLTVQLAVCVLLGADYQYLRPGLQFGSKTLEPLNSDIVPGQRFAPSAMDIFRINRLYQCPQKLGKYEHLLFVSTILVLWILQRQWLVYQGSVPIIFQTVWSSSWSRSHFGLRRTLTNARAHCNSVRHSYCFVAWLFVIFCTLCL